MIQEEGSIFSRVTVLTTLTTNVHVNMCLILNGYQDRVFWISRPNSIKFLFFGGWMMSEVCKIKVDIWDELLGRILDDAVRKKEHEDQLKRKPYDLRTWVAKFKHLLWTEKFHFNIKIKIKLTLSNFCFFITIHNDFVFADAKSSITVTIQNYTSVHMNSFRYHGRHYSLQK